MVNDVQMLDPGKKKCKVITEGRKLVFWSNMLMIAVYVEPTKCSSHFLVNVFPVFWIKPHVDFLYTWRNPKLGRFLYDCCSEDRLS